jgi:catechol 2,3-dioxygenase-like lactoylglutathione lyase family enzyme
MSFGIFFKRLALVSLAFGLVVDRLPADGTGRDFRIPSLYHVGFWVRDIGKSRSFYKTCLGFDEPYVLNHPDGVLKLVVIKVNDHQAIYLFPDASKISSTGDNFDHLGFETDAAAALRDYLAVRGVNVGRVQQGRIGDLILAVKDPDGHLIEFTQFEPQGQLRQHRGKNLAATRISTHLLAASVAVADPAASLHFYRDILGFKEIGRDGGEDGAPRSIRLRVPDGTDYLDLRPYKKKPHADPPRSAAQFFLEVPDAREAFATLAARAKSAGLPSPVTSDRNREVGCLDPDGTRVVLVEKLPFQ